VLQAFLVVLALLIAYNAASINADERARERATLFAFGLPTRRLSPWRRPRGRSSARWPRPPA
jgi:putative ABC transport system permease protein